MTRQKLQGLVKLVDAGQRGVLYRNFRDYSRPEKIRFIGVNEEAFLWVYMRQCHLVL